MNPTGTDFYISQQLAETYREMIKRRPILTGAAQSLGLSYIPDPGSVSASTVEGTQLLEIYVRDTDPERAGLQIVMLTAKGRDTEVAKGLALGADAYVTKPFSTKDLVAKVKELLAR